MGCVENNHTIREIGKMVKACIPEAVLEIDEGDFDSRDYRVDFGKLHRSLPVEFRYGVRDGIEEIRREIEAGRISDYREKKYSNVDFWKDEATLRKLLIRVNEADAPTDTRQV